MTPLERLDRFVKGHISIAGQKPTPAEAEGHLTSWAEWVNDRISMLGGEDPYRLEGASAFDLANAREALMAAVTPVKAQIAGRAS